MPSTRSIVCARSAAFCASLAVEKAAYIDGGTSAQRRSLCGRSRSSFLWPGARASSARAWQSNTHKRSRLFFQFPPPPPPIFNPSTPNTVPQTGQTHVSPNVRQAPFRGNLRPIGQDLRLTIVSTDENDPASNPGDDIDKDRGNAVKAAHEKSVDSIREMNAALHTCWMPPPKDSARHGMEYTIRFAFKRDGEIIAPPRVTYSSHDAPADMRDVYRDAVNAALARCTPLHFSDGMAGAVAGRPIAIRFVDNRTIDDGKAP